jgi:hypothetical protein
VRLLRTIRENSEKTVNGKDFCLPVLWCVDIDNCVDVLMIVLMWWCVDDIVLMCWCW